MSLKVHLIGRTVFDVESFINFLSAHSLGWRRSENASGTDEFVEAAGRICYLSFGRNQSPKSNAEYIRHLIVEGHESVLEHVSWSFLIEGISRACTHQLVRHRVGFSFSQLSQQYHDESDVQCVEPYGLDAYPAAAAAWSTAAKVTKEAYRTIIDELGTGEECQTPGIGHRERLRAIRSAARSILPNAAETKIVMTANARALRHFLNVRGTIPGDTEMRCLSSELLRHLKNESPSIFFDFDSRIHLDGIPIVYRVEKEA
jgi:thymidylate synthase (FAD)